MNRWFMVKTLKQSRGHHSGSYHSHYGKKKYVKLTTMSSSCWWYFLISKALSTRNSSPLVKLSMASFTLFLKWLWEPHPLPDLAPWAFPLPQEKILAEKTSFRHNWGDPGRIAGGAQHIHISRGRTSRDGNHGKNVGITVYMPKGITLKEMVGNSELGCFLFCTVKFPKLFGRHLVVCVHTHTLYIHTYIYVCIIRNDYCSPPSDSYY